MKVIVGDYSSKDKSSLLTRCEQKRSEYDGLLHAGVIHYVQGNYGDGGDFVLKAAIKEILDKCPSVWPEDLTERVARGESPEITEAMQKEFKSLNQGLIIPIEGTDVIEVIRLAKEFLAEANKESRTPED